MPTPRVLVLTLLVCTFFLPYIIALSVSVSRPQNCVSAPTSRPSLLRRKLLYPNPKALSKRGNPICYYLESALSDLLSTSAPSLEFIIPAGLWAVRWELSKTRRGRYPAVDGIPLFNKLVLHFAMKR